MFDYGSWISAHVPIYEEWGAVDEMLPYRVKVDGEGRAVRFLLCDQWYDCLWPIFELARLINAGIKWVSPPGIIQTLHSYIDHLVINMESLGVPFAICIAGLASYLAEKTISIGKFTYKSYGYGEGPYGKVPFGGGPVAHEMPVTT